MRLQITFDKKTHPQGLPVYQNPKVKNGQTQGRECVALRNQTIYNAPQRE
jgi:hypothetical protein